MQNQEIVENEIFPFSQGQIHWGFLRNHKKRLILLDFLWIIEFPYQFSHRNKFLARKSKIFELLSENLRILVRIWLKIWLRIWEFDRKSEWEIQNLPNYLNSNLSENLRIWVRNSKSTNLSEFKFEWESENLSEKFRIYPPIWIQIWIQIWEIEWEI